MYAELSRQADEARMEFRRILMEKGLGVFAGIVFLFRASSRAKKCTYGYIDAVMAGGTNIFCACGYHLPRRKMRATLTKKVVKGELGKISGKLQELGVPVGDGYAAKFFIQLLDQLRQELARPDVLKELYVDSDEAVDMVPKMAHNIVRRFCAGEISAEQAEDEFIELKGHYQMLFDELGIEPPDSEVVVILVREVGEDEG